MSHEGLTGGAALAAMLFIACGGPERPPTPPGTPVAGSARGAAPPPELALRLPGGAEVWFTLAREARDSTGAPCVERALEIRDGPRKVTVPLLYTGDMPVVVNDTTIRTRLWNGCRPGASYRVDVRTGRPLREDA